MGAVASPSSTCRPSWPDVVTGRSSWSHFYLPSTDPAYLADLRAALSEANVQLECFLIDDGDPTDATGSAPGEDWVSGWLDVAVALGAPRARVVAGKSEPTPLRLDASAAVLRRLAERHPELRVVTENWHALLPNADAVIALLERTENQVGFLVDLGNWRGPGKYDDLARVAHLAETCRRRCGWPTPAWMSTTTAAPSPCARRGLCRPAGDRLRRPRPRRVGTSGAGVRGRHRRLRLTPPAHDTTIRPRLAPCRLRLLPRRPAIRSNLTTTLSNHQVQQHLESLTNSIVASVSATMSPKPTIANTVTAK